MNQCVASAGLVSNPSESRRATESQDRATRRARAALRRSASIEVIQEKPSRVQIDGEAMRLSRVVARQALSCSGLRFVSTSIG
jgi:hypothetical protein